MFKHQKGFTLVELLVVISIASLLASIVLNSLKGVRVKARDARRMTDLKEIQKALTLYYHDYGAYPGMSVSTGEGANWGQLGATLASYISLLPKDPLNSGDNVFTYYPDSYYYTYICTSGGCQDYDLIAQFEDKTNPNRCELKCWKFHSGSSEQPSWCDCVNGPGLGFPPNIFADH